MPRSPVISWSTLLIVVGFLCLQIQAQRGDTNQPAREAVRLEKEQAVKDKLLNDGPPIEEFKGTLFNELEVPSMIELGKTAENDVKDGSYWLVEAFSPYCGHCKSLAPKLQTIYEFYYTSDPLPASPDAKDPTTSLNTFSRFYNIKFAKLDCVAFGTACSHFNAQSYPTLFLFKDGEEIKKSTGDRDMSELSAFLEECLEIIRPGSRPAGGLPELPTAGVSSFSTKHASLASDPAVAGHEATKGPRRSINPDGLSEVFNMTTFDDTVTKSTDPWFLKFYAPWCPHCQRMAPSWKAMAKEMQGKLNIGEVNCDEDKKLCKQMGVDHYPVLKVVKGPDHIDYEGLRGVGDLIDFAKKTAGAMSAVQDVTLKEFEAIEEMEEVIFIFFHDHATTTEDFQALERLPVKLINKAKLVKTSDPEMIKRYKVTTWPRLFVSRKGRATSFDHLMPSDIRDVDKVTKWMQSVWLPLVPELLATNGKQLLRGKYNVLAILDRSSHTFTAAQKELETAAIEWLEKAQQVYELERQELRDAKQLRIEEAQDRDNERAEMNAKMIKIDMNAVPRKEVTFAWIDGVFWERWIKTEFGISVKDGERVVIYDQDDSRFWDTTITGNAIVPSRTSVLETLNRVVSSPSSLSSKASGGSVLVYFTRARNAIIRNPWISLPLGSGILFLVIMAVLQSRRQKPDYSNGAYLPLNGHGPNGMLGGNKAD